jgi:hypothetical protein
MISLWKIIRNLSAIAGFILLLGTAGTTDYYANELRQAAPSYCDRNLIIGLVLILPMIIHLIVETYKEGREDNVD